MVHIAGYRHMIYVSPDDSHFSDINLLGADFCNVNIPIPKDNFNVKTEKLYFNNKWEVKLKL